MALFDFYHFPGKRSESIQLDRERDRASCSSRIKRLAQAILLIAEEVVSAQKRDIPDIITAHFVKWRTTLLADVVQ